MTFERTIDLVSTCNIDFLYSKRMNRFEFRATGLNDKLTAHLSTSRATFLNDVNDLTGRL